MKVIALCGVENSGKSHTINIVYSFLLRDGYQQIPGQFRILGNPIFEDVFDILIKRQHKVGIVGMGDYVRGQGKSIASLLDEFYSSECEVAICACRDNPSMLSAVYRYPSHQIINKTQSTGRENDRIVNVADALRIVSLI